MSDSPESPELEARLRSVRDRIARAAIASGRSPDEVALLLATKTVSPETLGHAATLGCRLFGENKAQEFLAKHEAAACLPVSWHFIGHLQRNKIAKVIPRIDCLHSIDRLRLAEGVQRHLESGDRVLDVLLQVNTSGEASKFGVSPADALRLAKEIALLPNLRLRGLMTIALFNADESLVRPCFRLLRDLRDRIRDLALDRVGMDVLSMGMSHDFEWAIEEGATLVRLGSAAFGPRSLPDSYYWPEY